MPLSFEPFPLLLKAARIVGVEFSTGFQRPPVGRFVLLPLVAGPGCYGNEDPRCDGVGKVRPVFPGQMRPDVTDGQQLAPRHGPHDFIIHKGRCEIHFFPAVLLDDGRVGDDLNFGHVRIPVKHGVKILGFLFCHFSRLLQRKHSIPQPPLQ